MILKVVAVIAFLTFLGRVMYTAIVRRRSMRAFQEAHQHEINNLSS